MVCPSRVSPYDVYSVSAYSDACSFSCTPVHYDGTFTPSNCTITIGGLAGAPQSVTSTSNGAFAASDCNRHTFEIATTAIDDYGDVHTNVGTQNFLECGKTPNGAPCY